MVRSRIQLLAFAAPATLFAACSLAPAPEAPEAPEALDVAEDMPADFQGAAEPGDHQPTEWWKAFADPALDRLVESVLESNLDLEGAVARVHQARERARIAGAAHLPTVQANAGLIDQRTPTNAGIGAQLGELGLGDFAPGFEIPDRLGIATWSLGADFAWETDFWGRARSEALAAGAEYLASESDYHAARIGVLTETIRAYFEIVEFRRQIELGHGMVDVLEDREEAAETRYDRGLADSLALYRIRQDLRDAEAGLPLLANGLAAAESRLAVLLGGYGSDLDAVLPDDLSPATVAAPVPAGIPADLLRQRPDVRAAGLRLEAARHTTDARRADLLPTLSFSGSIGLQATGIDGLFKVEQWFSNLASNLLAPLFNGGRLRGALSVAEARLGETAAAYGLTVVTAVNEVEAALTALENQGRRHALLASRLEEARATETLRSQRYEAGIGGYADFLDALRARLGVEASLAGAERDLALARLAVHRALGGGWTAPLPETPPAVAVLTRTSEPGE